MLHYGYTIFLSSLLLLYHCQHHLTVFDFVCICVYFGCMLFCSLLVWCIIYLVCCIYYSFIILPCTVYLFNARSFCLVFCLLCAFACPYITFATLTARSLNVSFCNTGLSCLEVFPVQFLDGVPLPCAGLLYAQYIFAVYTYPRLYQYFPIVDDGSFLHLWRVKAA